MFSLFASPLFFQVYLCTNVGPGSASCRTACPICSTVRQVSESGCVNVSPVCPGCPSPPLLPVWMNVSSLSPWLSDFRTVRFSVSSGFFFFYFKLLLSFFLLCEEVQCVCLPTPPSWLELPSIKIFLKFLFYIYFDRSDKMQK